MADTLRALPGSQPVADLNSIRLSRLNRTLWAGASAHPFYRERFRALGFVADDIRTLDDLEKLPVTGKDEYIADPEAFRLHAGVTDINTSSPHKGSVVNARPKPLTMATAVPTMATRL